MHTLLQRKNVAKMRRKSGARMCFAHSLLYHRKFLYFNTSSCIDIFFQAQYVVDDRQKDKKSENIEKKLKIEHVS